MKTLLVVLLLAPLGFCDHGGKPLTGPTEQPDPLSESGTGQGCKGWVSGEGVCVRSHQCLQKSGKHIGRCTLKSNGLIGSCCNMDRYTTSSTEVSSSSTPTKPPQSKTTSTTTTNIPLISSATSKADSLNSSKNKITVSVNSQCQISKNLDFRKEQEGSQLLSRKRRVVGGQDIEDSKHPWAVRILQTDSKGADNHICGGTLLANGWVLSAAHCFEDTMKSRLQFAVYNVVTEERVFYKAFIILSHPSFDMSKSLSYDAALVKLRMPKSILNQLLPACASPTLDIEDIEATAFGWGREDEEVKSKLSQDLKDIKLHIYPNKECFYRKVETSVEFAEDLMVCAGLEDRTVKGQSTCKGDSGSGLMVMADKTKRNSASESAVVGIVSWGFGCGGRKDRPTVFQRVAPLYTWIQQTINRF